jgi:hypothetical protein
MDFCVRLFCVCVVLFVGRSHETGWSHVQGDVPIVYRIKKLRERPSPTKDCRAIIVAVVVVVVVIIIRRRRRRIKVKLFL